MGSSVAEVVGFESDEARLDAWIQLAYAARAQDSRWIAPQRKSLRAQFAANHPLWRHVSRRLFLLEGRARCTAMVNPRLKAPNGTPWGQVGFFECLDDDAGKLVLDAACRWLTERGCRHALGPMNGSTWHSYRFVTHWHDADPLLLEPNNPLRYPQLWAAHGWNAAEPEYYSSRQDNAGVVRALDAQNRAGAALGYHVERADLSNLRAVLERVFELSRVVFAGNAYYSDTTWEEFSALYDGIERLADPSLVQWLRAPGSEIVGFGFGVPDYAARAARMRGEDSLLARIRWLTGARPRQTLLKTMGIVPAHQGKGLASMIFHAQATQSHAHGYPVGIRTLMAADNRSFSAGRALHQVIREYHLFERAL